ncbi:trypsin-like peptidase domain-containing protein [Pedobacter hiemivivus]|uniref:Serine protease n=1 Tax=Pedobacter hiemivivus TaxID=2530454 RepID=A0A4U1GH39_9SPHI|nr:serine protease [Pedobacter hiemivivus]TCC91118.1 serine protease [Pedobacter hiemivivus]TKC63517.1 trypsin-like peptidase domain-containing protein [Pedobacter hiemivivus]
MRNEIELEGIIEDYLNGKLNEEEAKAFEQLRLNDPSVDHKVVAHKVFLESLNDYASISDLKNKMNQVHAQIDVETLSRQLGPHPSFIVNIWRKNKAAIAVAASFILLTVVTLYSIQQTTQQSGSVELVSRELAKIKNSQSNLIRKINSSNVVTPNLKPANFGGTGFALTSNGYILTNLHVVADADSVYVQDSKGNSYKAVVKRKDSQYDLAILKIEDKSFNSLSNLPYRLKQNVIGMGESVYTLGFPKDDAVYGQGYVSSKTGYNGDTTQYQVSIPVNPGNSGGPLLDHDGNIIGVISAKQNQVDGATFAVKSKYIQEALNSIPNDSLGTKVAFSKRNSLQGLSKPKQVNKIKDYVFMIKVYK